MTYPLPRLIGLLALLSLLPACGASSSENEAPSYAEPTPPPGGGVSPSPSPSPPKDSGSGDPASSAPPPTGEGEGESPPPGQLTAGDWDDNLNFGVFQAWIAQPPTGFAPHPSADRVVITVRDEEGVAIPNARVTVKSATGTRLEAPTATDGRLLFLPTFDGAGAGESFTVTVAPPPGQPGTAHTTAVEGSAWNLTLPGGRGVLPSALDVAFVVDTTGSMNDELSYLKAELRGIVDSVRESFPQVSPRFALVVYRDIGDEYVVRSFDFTDNLDTFRQQLAAQSSGGGGDMPEAMERGLGAIHQLSWRPGNAARLTFLVADAPSHTAKHADFVREAHRARLAGIKVYPVAASGTTPEAEYQLRIAAQLTLGRYLFLTDDSGIGNPHAEPHIPCYQVQLLKHLLTRALSSELEGRRVPARGTDVLRTVGSPRQDGSCTLKDGTVTWLAGAGAR